MSQFMTSAMRNITDISSAQNLAINNNNYSGIFFLNLRFLVFRWNRVVKHFHKYLEDSDLFLKHSKNSENRSENSNPNNVLEIAAQLLFSLVHWTRSLPAFGDISVKDQVNPYLTESNEFDIQSILLSSNWAQLFFISCAMLHSNSVDIFSSSNISQLLNSCSIDQSSISSLKVCVLKILKMFALQLFD